jgi:hypothetical protein
MKPITPEDVARLLNGEVTDKHEWLRITQAVETDPKVQAWYDQLDIESLLPDDDDPEQLAETSGRAALIARSRLFRLHLDVSPAKLLTELNSARGQVVGEIAEASRTFDCTLRRVADDPPAFELTVAGWPEDWQPLAVLLGRFAYVDRQPAVKTFPLKRARIRRADIGLGENLPAADSGTFQPMLGFLTLDSAPSGNVPRELSAHSASSGPAGRSDDIEWGFDEHQGRLLHVIARVPDNREGDVLVAELRCTNSAGEPVVQWQLVVLDRRLDDGRWRGSAAFAPLGELGSRQVTITVRSLTDADVVPFLARQSYVSLPIEPAASGFRFQARWADQQAAARDLNTRWCLQAAPSGKEG